MITVGEGRYKYKVCEAEDKTKLLEKGIWTKSECATYFGIPLWKMTPVFKKIKNNPPFKRCIYRDEILNCFNTSWEKEVAIIKNLKELNDGNN